MYEQVFLPHPVFAYHGYGGFHPAQHNALAAALSETNRLAMLQADPILIAQGAVAKALQHVVVEDNAVLQDLDEGRPPMARRRLDRLAKMRLVGDYRAGDKGRFGGQRDFDRMDRLLDGAQGTGLRLLAELGGRRVLSLGQAVDLVVEQQDIDVQIAAHAMDQVICADG